MSDFFTLMDLAIRADAPTGVFNVSSGEGHTIKEIFDLVANHLDLNGFDAPLVPPGEDDVPAVVLDPSAAQRAFNWERRSVDQAIARQLAWYDSFGVSDVHSHLAAPAVSR